MDIDRFDEEMRLEKAVLQQGGMVAFQLIMLKLSQTAEEMQKQYDTVDYAREPEKAIRIQMYRRVVLQEIPRIVENLMNHDRPENKGRFSFWEWLKTRLSVTSAEERE